MTETQAEEPEELDSDADDTSSSGSSSSSGTLNEVDGAADKTPDPPQTSSESLPPDPSGGAPSELKSRLASFLPALRKANAQLDDSSEVEKARIDAVGEHEERYIEMELGLGVLEEMRRKWNGDRDGDVRYAASSSSEDESESDEDEDVAQVGERVDGEAGKGEGEENVLGKLMGEQTTTTGHIRAKRKIQEVD